MPPLSPDEEARIERGNKLIALGVGGVALVGVLAFAVASIVSPGSNSDDRPDTISAWSACKTAVEPLLKAPSTAEFPSSLELDFTQKGKALVTRAYVDSQNGFGAMIRSSFTCRATPDGADGFTAKITGLR